MQHIFHSFRYVHFFFEISYTVKINEKRIIQKLFSVQYKNIKMEKNYDGQGFNYNFIARIFWKDVNAFY